MGMGKIILSTVYHRNQLRNPLSPFPIGHVPNYVALMLSWMITQWHAKHTLGL